MHSKQDADYTLKISLSEILTLLEHKVGPIFNACLK